MTSKQNEENKKEGQQGTLKPWEKPGQSSQDPSLDPPAKPERTYEDNKTA